MTSISRAIVETPIWVWALLAFLIVIGVRSLKPTTAPLWRLAILPMVFLIWGLASLLATFKPSPLTISAWAAALLVGGALGYVLMARRRITVDRQSRCVTLPGSPANLALILLIFACKYAFGYLQATRPGIVADPAFIFANLGLSGVLSGILVGRFFRLFLQYGWARSAAPAEPA
ncbi:MAG: hypothetical protein IT538_10255 [Variibacter sp.]|nr:hypothetical protein [Variibacter sp.]